MSAPVIGELALEIALAIKSEDFEYLRAVLAKASNYWEVADAKMAIRNAIAPLLPEQQQWFYKAVYLIQSGGEPN